MYFPIKGIIYEMQPFAHNQGIQGDGRRSKCSELELNTVECLEAYGMTKGATKCAQYMEDLNECRYQRIRLARFFAMRRERQRQVLRGERKLQDYYAERTKYDYDAYFSDVFTP